jgi:lysylphosphatidylglycerol synthetase-like protein (DUF2156 family)
MGPGRKLYDAFGPCTLEWTSSPSGSGASRNRRPHAFRCWIRELQPTSNYGLFRHPLAVASACGVVILLELVGLYANQAEVTGPVGLVSFLVAFLGTALVVGVTWNELFVASYMAVVAPRVLDAAPTGSLALGFSLSFGIFALGWLLFGHDTLRAGGVYPRAAAILLIIGAVVFISHLYPPLGSCLARPWLGWASHYSLERSDQYESPASKLG